MIKIDATAQIRTSVDGQRTGRVAMWQAEGDLVYLGPQSSSLVLLTYQVRSPSPSFPHHATGPNSEGGGDSDATLP